MLDQEFIEGLKIQPETYKTILKEKFDNRNTITNVVRKKISSLIKFNFICVGVLDGTRFGERIFYVLDKNYFIIIYRHKQQFHYMYCQMITELDEDKLILKESYKLENDRWEYKADFLISRDWLVRFF